MRRDTEDELQRLSEALLMEETPPQPEASEAPEWDGPIIEDDFSIGDIAEYKNHANNYGNAFNADRTELSPESLSDALLSQETEEKGRGGLLLIVFILTLAILGVAVYWAVLR